MKQYIALFIMALSIASCNQKASEQRDTAFTTVAPQQSPYKSYGAKITSEGAITASKIGEQYEALKTGDTALVKFEAPITSVCKSRGCWMRLDAGDEEVFVKFKDYGFFVPLDAAGDAVVQGKAYLEEVSVDELKHMAKDAGKSANEIAAINTPKRELRFMADGVLIKSK